MKLYAEIFQFVRRKLKLCSLLQVQIGADNLKMKNVNFTDSNWAWNFQSSQPSQKGAKLASIFSNVFQTRATW